MRNKIALSMLLSLVVLTAISCSNSRVIEVTNNAKKTVKEAQIEIDKAEKAGLSSNQLSEANMILGKARILLKSKSSEIKSARKAEAYAKNAKKLVIKIKAKVMREEQQSALDAVNNAQKKLDSTQKGLKIEKPSALLKKAKRLIKTGKKIDDYKEAINLSKKIEPMIETLIQRAVRDISIESLTYQPTYFQKNNEGPELFFDPTNKMTVTIVIKNKGDIEEKNILLKIDLTGNNPGIVPRETMKTSKQEIVGKIMPGETRSLSFIFSDLLKYAQAWQLRYHVNAVMTTGSKNINDTKDVTFMILYGE